MYNLKNLDDVHCVRNGKELIDVEENFTMSINGSFKIDLSFFVTLLPLLWEAAIKTTRIERELLMLIWHFFMEKVLEEE